MAALSSRISKAEIKRVISAIGGAGLDVEKVELDPTTGKIIFEIGGRGNSTNMPDDGWGDFDEAPKTSLRS